MKRIFLFLTLALFLLPCACSDAVEIRGERVFPAGASFEATFSVNGAAFPALLELPANGALRLALTGGAANGAVTEADDGGSRWRCGEFEIPLAERTGKAEVLRRAILAFRAGTYSVSRSAIRAGEALSIAQAGDGWRASLTLSPDLSPALLELSTEKDRIRIDFHRTILSAYSIPGE